MKAFKINYLNDQSEVVYAKSVDDIFDIVLTDNKSTTHDEKMERFGIVSIDEI